MQELPKEDIKPGEEGMCGRLNYSMYGTRGAAANWADEYTGLLVEAGDKAQIDGLRQTDH